jgi:fatty acid desaturase
MSPENNRPWIETLLPVLIVLGLAALAMIWNIVAAVAILIVGLGIVLARYVQRHQPPEPGE